jgi:hypothetical protein
MPDNTLYDSIIDLGSLCAALTVLGSVPLACAFFCARKKLLFYIQNSAVLFFIVRGMCLGMPWLIADNTFCPTIIHGNRMIVAIGISIIVGGSWILLQRGNWRQYAFWMLIAQICVSIVASITVLNFELGYIIVGALLVSGLYIMWRSNKAFSLQDFLR